MVLMTVSQPIEELIPIEIGDQEQSDRSNDQQQEHMVLLVADRCPLHRQQISPGQSADDRYQQKRAEPHSAKPQHVT
jgi:hypothetical protein